MSVNIVYPIDGHSYPIIDPNCKIDSGYFTFSFSATCSGGPVTVKWGINNDDLGKALFYDQFTAQFVHKLRKGTYEFWVDAGLCGTGSVGFTIA